MEEICWRLLILLCSIAELMSAETTPITKSAMNKLASCPVPRPCECERTADRLVLNCRQQRLPSVPIFNQSDELIDELTLAGNNIAALMDNAFRGLKVLRLDLRDNRLSSVSPAAFSGLERHLKQLHIQLAPSADFPSEALKPLTLLRVLHVVGFGRSYLPSGALAPLGLVCELRLTNGDLRRLSPVDVTTMRASLSVVDLSGNPLRTVPTAALATLSNLTDVLLSGCYIAHLGAQAFATNWTRLRRIDLSRNQLESVHEDAFRGVGGQSVRELSIRSSHLSDEHVSALLPLTRLRRLNIAHNNKITSVDRLLSALPSLETLDARSDGVSAFGRVPYRVFPSRLKVLNVADNPLIDVASDAFVRLTALEELRLDGARLSLANDTFAVQRNSLRTLSLSHCNFTQAPWSSIAGLSALQTLYLNKNSLRSIPDFTFMDVGRLQELDLRDNSLQQLTQRSLAGLHSHLENIKLENNRLTMLDRCVFYRFESMDFLKLSLTNNPLRCVCGLRWLYKRLQRYNDTFWYSGIRWHCADIDKMFNTLHDADFDSCSADSGGNSTAGECEDLIPTTTPSVTYPDDHRLGLVITEKTHSSVTMEWTVAASVNVVEQLVTHHQLGTNVTDRLKLAATQRRHVFTGLKPDTVFKVCVELNAANDTSNVDPIISCRLVTTSSKSLASIDLIIGVGVGGGLVAVIIVSVAVYCCCAARRRRRGSVSSSAPKQSVQTKRFRKLGTVISSPPGGERTSNQNSVTQADVDRAIVESVERLDPDTKETLVNLLRTASAYSLDNIGGASFYPSPPSSVGYNPPGSHARPTSTGDRHFYEELPDDTYDKIPTDDYV